MLTPSGCECTAKHLVDFLQRKGGGGGVGTLTRFQENYQYIDC